VAYETALQRYLERVSKDNERFAVTKKGEAAAVICCLVTATL
jgi:hypothetical protein